MLLLHNAERLLNPFDPTVKEKQKLTAKRTKQTDEDRMMVARLEWTLSWYWDDTLGPVIPTTAIYASLFKAAKRTRGGTQFKDAVDDATPDSRAVLVYDGPRGLDSLWGKGLGQSPYVDYRPVGQQAVKIMRCRPKLHAWSCQSRWIIDDTILNVDDFSGYAEAAGMYNGLGDYRQFYGRFSVDIKEV